MRAHNNTADGAQPRSLSITDQGVGEKTGCKLLIFAALVLDDATLLRNKSADGSGLCGWVGGLLPQPHTS